MKEETLKDWRERILGIQSKIVDLIWLERGVEGLYSALDNAVQCEDPEVVHIICSKYADKFPESDRAVLAEMDKKALHAIELLDFGIPEISMNGPAVTDFYGLSDDEQMFLVCEAAEATIH